MIWSSKLCNNTVSQLRARQLLIVLL